MPHPSRPRTAHPRTRILQSLSSPTIAAAVVIASLALPTSAFPAHPLPSAEAKQLAFDHLRAHAAVLGLTDDDVADVIVTDCYSSDHTGVTHVYLRQRHRGIDVAGAMMTLNVTADGRIVRLGHRFLPNLAARVEHEAPSVAAAAAETMAASDLGPTQAVPVSDTPAMLIYLPQADGRLRLAWDVVVDARGGSGFSGNVVVDARNGEILERRSWTGELAPAAALSAPGEPATDQGVPDGPAMMSPDSYLVFAIPKEHPDDGPRTDEADPSLAGGLSSPFGWHDTNGVAGGEFTTTQGNNASAYADADNNNVPDPGSAPDGGAGLNFLFPIDLTQIPIFYRPAAVINAFYWVNVAHDVLWRYGFNEPAGSFQANSYGRGGLGNDALLVEVQDGGGANNANIVVGADGVAPRMQLFVWNFATPARDAALANGVVADLYFYGAANRLVGGPGAPGCLSVAESAGLRWGWADWFGLVMTAVPSDAAVTPRGIGTYLLGQPATGVGLRARPYTTDFAVNNFTHADLPAQTNSQGVGTVWATMLWELYWELVDDHGFNPSLYDAWTTGGNNLALQLIVDSMKLAPCNPGFVNARDAILAADLLLTGGANRCAIWRAFARRGLGSSASQGTTNSIADGVAAFDLPADCVVGVEDPSSGLPRFDHALRVHPNPFRAQTSVSFALAVPGRATIEIFDLHGRILRRIETDRLAAGRNRIAWDGRGEDGRALTSGEYVVRLTIDGEPAATQKTMLVR